MKKVEKKSNNSIVIDRDWLYNKYFNEEISILKISKILGCSHGAVSRKFYKFGFKKMSSKDRAIFRGNKKCYTCKEVKPLGCFYKSRERSDGFDRNCINCVAELGRKHRDRWRKENIEKEELYVFYKFCHRCSKVKKFTDFYKCACRSDGLDSYCKECTNNKNKKLYERICNKNIDKIPVEHKMCSECGIVKPAKEFFRSSGKNSRLTSHCKECQAIYKAKYYTHNKDKILNKNRNWRNNNRLKTRKKDKARYDAERNMDDYTLEDENITRLVFNNRCFKCGSVDNITIDHHYCLNNGNGLSIGNAVLLCRSCNSSKHTKNPEKFYSSAELKAVNELLKKAKKYKRENDEK